MAKNALPTGGWCNYELSIKLDLNLIAGNTYQIWFYDYSSSLFNNNQIPIEICLSVDSLNFGDSIYSSLPSFDQWINRTFQFMAPNNGKYLTVRNENTGTISAWNFVDNFTFTLMTEAENQQNSLAFALYLNPFENSLTISINDIETTQIILYDITLRKRLVQSFTNNAIIKTEELSNGVYFYEVSNRFGNIKTGKIIKQ